MGSVRVDTWPLAKGEAALYTGDAAVAHAAGAAGLKPFGEYYDRRGRVFALQFRGPADAVKQVQAKVKQLPEEPILQPAAPEKESAGAPDHGAKKILACRKCGREFEAGSNRQVFCSGCRVEVTQAAARQRVGKHRGRAEVAQM